MNGSASPIVELRPRVDKIQLPLTPELISKNIGSSLLSTRGFKNFRGKENVEWDLVYCNSFLSSATLNSTSKTAVLDAGLRHPLSGRRCED